METLITVTDTHSGRVRRDFELVLTRSEVVVRRRIDEEAALPLIDLTELA